MENAKCKGKIVSTNRGRKTGKKAEKRTKKTKGKEGMEPLIGTRHKCCQLTAQKPFRGLPINAARGVEGMFFKGLRTRYITREALGQVHEARKKEDINKIIDIGRIYFQLGELAMPPGRHGADDRKLDKSPSADSDQDFDCLPTPRRPPLTRPEEPTYAPLPQARRRREANLAKRNPHSLEQLHDFSLKYEATAAAQILAKLPENGVLEDALAALRKLHGTRQDGPQREEPQQSCEAELETDGHILGRSFLGPEEPLCESFEENPLENMFVKSTPEVESASRSGFFTEFVNDDEAKRQSVVEFRARDFQKPAKEFEIRTPCIQFYRRNMF